MKITRRVVFGILVAGLLFLGGFLLRDVLLVHLVKPIALLLWIGNRLIGTIDQAAYWAGLILVLLYITLRRLSKQSRFHEVERAETRNGTLHSIHHWRTLILLTSGETDRVNFLQHAMQTLLKDIFASKQPSQVPWKVSQDIEQGDIRVPASIRKFLMLDPPANAHPTMMQRFGQAPARMRQWTGQDRLEYYKSIAEVISFMEKELENDDEQ